MVPINPCGRKAQGVRYQGTMQMYYLLTVFSSPNISPVSLIHAQTMDV